MEDQTFLCPVFEVFITGSVKCKVCESFTGVAHSMRRSHVPGHLETKKHKRSLQALQTLVDDVPVNILAAPVEKQPELSISIDSMSLADNPCLPSPHSMSPQAEEPPDDADYPLADLWGDLLSDRTYAFTDYFEEMQSQMEEGKTLVTCLLRSDDELGLEMDCDAAVTCDDEDELFDVLASGIGGMSVNIVVRGPC